MWYALRVVGIGVLHSPTPACRISAMETSQLAAWPLAQHNDIDDEELGKILTARLRGREARLAELESQERELAAKIAREREHVAHLSVLLHDLGMTPPSSSVAATTTGNGTQPDRPRSKVFVAGNKNPKMPPRRPEYVSVSLTEAARRLLSRGETMHINDISRAVYHIENDAQLRLVNATMRSMLAVGVNKGQWERGEQSGTFRMRRDSGATSW
jgi:hypothetical protein